MSIFESLLEKLSPIEKRLREKIMDLDERENLMEQVCHELKSLYIEYKLL